MDSINCLHGGGGTGHEIRKCPRDVAGSNNVHSLLSASKKWNVTECVNRKRKCENLSQDPYFTPFSDPCFYSNTTL